MAERDAAEAVTDVRDIEHMAEWLAADGDLTEFMVFAPLNLRMVAGEIFSR
jgi:hypothetical protein